MSNNVGNLISIIMPAYNAEKSIVQSIESVLKQTYNDWELLIIDDKSTDNTLNIILNIAKDNNKIKVLRNKENIGVTRTRNKGIAKSRGEWIAFLDSDDIWESDKLQQQLEFISKGNIDFLFTGASYINEFGEIYNGIFNVPEKVDYYSLRKHNVISCSSVIVRKKLLDEISIKRDDFHEDFVMWMEILKKNNIYAYGLDKPLLIYRLSSKSKSGNKFKSIFMTYKGFRYLGLNVIESSYFTVTHLLGAIKKYRRILSNN